MKKNEKKIDLYAVYFMMLAICCGIASVFITGNIPSVSAVEPVVETVVVKKDEHYNIEELRMEFAKMFKAEVYSADYEGDAHFYDANMSNALVQWFTERSIDTKYTGEIFVVYDLDKTTIEQNGKKLVVTLPKAETRNEAELFDYKDDDSFLGREITYSDYEALKAEIEADELSSAIDQGLYEDAQDSMKESIQKTVDLVVGRHVEVEVYFN